ncbi:hypothetical protein CEXT_541441 [Caerostris extrusa]|uniref:Uncharacterized protein n=1 Tax=Caerostris extrusa TaxID=172846 RepID=A0AAV4MUB0_CAEEX|nr:hypothetical protein CEXT_541441 [Caerostris extrusa]
MCRQLSTAMKEMDVIDSIVEQSKRSDLPQDYIQINANLLQKRHYLVEWVSRFQCPISDCALHNNTVNISNVTVNSKVNAGTVNNGKINAYSNLTKCIGKKLMFLIGTKVNVTRVKSLVMMGPKRLRGVSNSQ